MPDFAEALTSIVVTIFFSLLFAVFARGFVMGWLAGETYQPMVLLGLSIWVAGILFRK
jgi:hypothetical protein